MRYVIAICLVLTTILARSQDSVLRIVSSNPPIVFDTTGEWVQHELELYNSGSDSVEITRVRGGCACANAVVLQRFIAPQDTGVVILSVSTAHFKSDTNRVSFTFASPDKTVDGMYVPLTIIRAKSDR